MKSSLIMATYNGEKYITQQLESIVKQTKKLDEVIIKDDCSTDATPKIVKKFIVDNHLVNWTFVENKQNLGWRQNFSELLSSAKGDVIFLSDQDDYWYPNKVEEMVETFLKNPDIELLVSDYGKEVDEGAKDVIMPPITELLISNNLYHIVPKEDNYYIGRPGWTFAIGKKLAKKFVYAKKYIPNKGHDVLLWQLALARNTLFHLRKKTGIWNLHSSSAMAIENKRKFVNNNLLVLYLSDEANMKQIMLEEIKNEKDTDFFNFLSSSRNCDIGRIDVLTSNSIIVLLKNWSRYNESKKFIGDIRRLIIPKYYKNN